MQIYTYTIQVLGGEPVSIPCYVLTERKAVRHVKFSGCNFCTEVVEFLIHNRIRISNINSIPRILFQQILPSQNQQSENTQPNHHHAEAVFFVLVLHIILKYVSIKTGMVNLRNRPEIVSFERLSSSNHISGILPSSSTTSTPLRPRFARPDSAARPGPATAGRPRPARHRRPR
jgi:hypothetical protein